MKQQKNNVQMWTHIHSPWSFFPNIKVSDNCHWPLRSWNEKSGNYIISLWCSHNIEYCATKKKCITLLDSQWYHTHTAYSWRRYRKGPIFRPSHYHEQCLHCGFIFGILKISYFERVHMQTKQRPALKSPGHGTHICITVLGQAISSPSANLTAG